jgi:hypothetical protein
MQQMDVPGEHLLIEWLVETELMADLLQLLGRSARIQESAGRISGHEPDNAERQERDQQHDKKGNGEAASKEGNHVVAP